MNFSLPGKLRESRPPRALAMIRRVLLSMLIIGPVIATPVFAYQTKVLNPENLQGEGSADEWVKMQPSGASATFEMPEKPRYVERIFRPVPDQPPITVRLHLVTVADENRTYMFSYHDLHAKPIDEETIKATLDGAVQGSVDNVLGQLVDRSELVDWKRNPLAINPDGNSGRQFACRFFRNQTAYIVTGRVILVDKRLYQLSSIMVQDSFDAKLVKKFFDSFEIIASEDDSPPRPRAAGSD